MLILKINKNIILIYIYIYYKKTTIITFLDILLILLLYMASQIHLIGILFYIIK